MIPDDHDVVGLLAAANEPGDRPDGTDALVGPHAQAHDCLSGSGAIRKRRRHRATPAGTSGPPSDREDDARILERERCADDRRQRDRIALRPLAVRRAPTPSPASADRRGPGSRRRCRRARCGSPVPTDRRDTPCPSPAPSSIGIGVDEDAGGATLLGRERFEAAVAVGHRVADERRSCRARRCRERQPVVVRRLARFRRRRPARSRRRRRSRRDREGRARRAPTEGVRITGDGFLAHRRAPRARRGHLDA